MSKFMEEVTAKAIANFNKKADTRYIELSKHEIFVITDVLRGRISDLHFKKKGITDQKQIARISENQDILREIIFELNEQGK